MKACVLVFMAAAVNTYVPENAREHMLAAGATVVGALLGWLGLAKPGQGK